MSVKKSYLIWLGIAGAVMFLPYLLNALFVPREARMFVTILLFFAAGPVCAIAGGVWAGRNCRSLWGMPLITCGMYLAGVWSFLDLGNPDFLVYAGLYLTQGLLAMGITAGFLRARRKKEK